MIRTKLLILTIFCALIVVAQPAVDNFRKNALLQRANISLLVKNITTGKTIAEYNSRLSIVPASTMKVVSTATALELLGREYRFKTTLEMDGQLLKDGTLNGNLYINGGGDPTLGSDKLGDKNFLQKWVEAVQSAGIKRINGKIIAVESCLEKQVINPRWTWEDMGNYFAPGIHSISYLDNTFKVVFNSGRIGTAPEIIRTEPEIPLLEFDNQLISSSTKSDNCYFYGAPYSLNRSLVGEIPANRNEFVSKGDMPHPALILLNDFDKALNTAGVETNSKLEQQFAASNNKVIYTHFSPILAEIISEVNFQSNNHYAEYVFKQISRTATVAGSSEGSATKISDYWAQKGLSTKELFQYDGSGLSPVNAVSANFFVELLEYMNKKSANSGAFFASLPVSGKTGTLKNFLSNTSLAGKVHAKSGTILRVKSYTGYIETSKGILAFAVVVNNANGASKEVTAKIENFLLEVSGR